jgi:hypothetical protein
MSSLVNYQAHQHEMKTLSINDSHSLNQSHIILQVNYIVSLIRHIMMCSTLCGRVKVFRNVLHIENWFIGRFIKHSLIELFTIPLGVFP